MPRKGVESHLLRQLQVVGVALPGPQLLHLPDRAQELVEGPLRGAEAERKTAARGYNGIET